MLMDELTAGSVVLRETDGPPLAFFFLFLKFFLSEYIYHFEVGHIRTRNY